MAIFYISSSLILFLLSLYVYGNRRETVNIIVAFMFFSMGFIPIKFLLLSSYPEFSILRIWIFYFPFLLLFALLYPFENEILSRIKYMKLYIFVPYILYFFSYFSVKIISPLLKEKLLIFSLITPFVDKILSLLYLLILTVLNLLYILFSVYIMNWKYKKCTNAVLKRQLFLLMTGTKFLAFVFVIDIFSAIVPELSKIFTSERIGVLYMLVVSLNAFFLILSMAKHRFLNVELKKRGVIYYIFKFVFVLIYAFFAYLILNRANSLLSDYLSLLLFVIILLLYLLYNSKVDAIISYFFFKEDIKYENILNEFFTELFRVPNFSIMKNLIIEKLPETINADKIDIIIYDYKGDDFLKAKYFSSEVVPYTIRRKFYWADWFFPIVWDNVFYGFLVVGEKRSGTKFNLLELKTISSVAGQIGVVIHNFEVKNELYEKKVLEKEFSLAKKIQFSLLPERDIKHDDWEIYWRYRPAITIGGDYTDVFIDEEKGYTFFLIADVSGKGVNGALYMSMIRTYLHAVFKYFDIEETFAGLNDYIRKNLPKNIFVTMAVFLYNSKKNKLFYFPFGHNYPILYRSKEEKIEFLEKDGIGLGLVDNMIFLNKVEHYIIDDIQKDDFIFLYTDGVTEAMNINKDFYGEERLLSLLERYKKETPEKIINKVNADLYDFKGSAKQSDDIAMLIFKRK